MAAEALAGLRDQPRLGERVQRVLARLFLRLPERLVVRLAGGAPPVVDGQRLDPGVHLLLRLRAARQPYGLLEPTIPVARARYRRETSARMAGRTRVGAVRDLVVAGAAGPLAARLYRPPGSAATGPLLVFFHGGGFVIGDLDTHDEPCRVLCRHAGTRVLSVAYRVAPEHPFPAAVDDAVAAHRWARANAAALGADPASISVGGDSAGGNLAAVVSHLGRARGEVPAAQLLVYPVVDPTTKRRSHELFATGLFLTAHDVVGFEAAYRGGRRDIAADPRVAPLLDPDLGGLPPTLVATAGFDLLRDEGEAYAEALRAAGGTVRLRREASLAHGFIHITDLSPTARRAMLGIAAEWRGLLTSTARS